jgi:hypothetical protein
MLCDAEQLNFCGCLNGVGYIRLWAKHAFWEKYTWRLKRFDKFNATWFGVLYLQCALQEEYEVVCFLTLSEDGGVTRLAYEFYLYAFNDFYKFFSA